MNPSPYMELTEQELREGLERADSAGNDKLANWYRSRLSELPQGEN